ncbi:MAG TPA: G/U mismatch-specific DNA glycosylase [Tepidisphaeraceae bacterium]|jgi:TDG/mug DNA glycosylase family protein
MPRIVPTSTPPDQVRPTKQQIASCVNKTIPDIIAPELKILFSGINPSLYSACVGHHFARPGNRFWPTLHAAGFTPRRFSPFEDATLVDLGYGLTNIVPRATAAADDLDASEYAPAAELLIRKLKKYQPKYLAILGLGAYRLAFDRPKASLGPQPELIGRTRIWILPNPSGLNAHYQLPDLARIYRLLRKAAEAA